VSIKNATSDGSSGHGPQYVTVELQVRGQGSLTELASALHEVDGIVDVQAGDVSELSF